MTLNRQIISLYIIKNALIAYFYTSLDYQRETCSIEATLEGDKEQHMTLKLMIQTQKLVTAII